MRWTLRIILVLLICLLLSPGGSPVLAQTATPIPVLVVPSVRQSLALEWRRARQNPAASERGYCLVAREVPPRKAFLVTGVVLPDSVVYADPYEIDFFCPAGTLSLHVHTPATCLIVPEVGVVLHSCTLDGPDAYICTPSETDQASLALRGDAFGVVQCDEHALVAYWPLSSHH